MAELDIGTEEERLRDDWITLAGERFQLLEDMRAITVEWYMALDPNTITVRDRLRLVRECLPDGEVERFNAALSKSRLTRDKTILLTNFLVEVYGKGRGGSNGRPPPGRDGSAPKGKETAPTSRAASRSPARRSASSGSAGPST